jgi:hypothetical protein
MAIDRMASHRSELDPPQSEDRARRDLGLRIVRIHPSPGSNPFGCDLASAAAAAALDGIDPGLALRCSGLGALLVWIAVTPGGTVPINAAVLDWDANAPPANWRAQVDRWEHLDTVRTWGWVLRNLLGKDLDVPVGSVDADPLAIADPPGGVHHAHYGR